MYIFLILLLTLHIAHISKIAGLFDSWDEKEKLTKFVTGNSFIQNRGFYDCLRLQINFKFIQQEAQKLLLIYGDEIDIENAENITVASYNLSIAAKML